ncbi:hypoxanthine phosphoribosyltransferase [bacterium]|nr:hypoxanthine phosphoribosyltransferase [bacterium]MCB1221265.1 hypoxanthine phosphoribosyltransferase [bacterium]UNM08930.1 MAG: hypoxanthine phosphoribosyltransferase [Planctomycetales bacterium]
MLEIPSYFTRLYTAAEIDKRVDEIAAQITEDFAGRKVHLVGVLRGANIFLSDLVRRIEVPLSYDFLAVSSYSGTSSTGVVRLIKDLDESIESEHVIVVEDIIDSGLTLNYILEQLQHRKPASVHVCAFLNRPHSRKVEMKIDYTGFEIPDKFVVGYGLDFEQKWRQLPDIWAIN